MNDLGQWWWSSGQRDLLLLLRSEFESRLSFSVKLYLKRTKLNKKRPGLALFYKMNDVKMNKSCHTGAGEYYTRRVNSFSTLT